MSDTPRISIVTPSLNQSQFIETTLRSVIAQGYPNLEYVVVDGGSTDGSLEIIERYAGDLTWWVSEPDNGHAHALNKGFAKTTGEIMGWINSSDVHYPWTLETIAQIFTQLPDVQWLMGVPTQLDERGGPRSVSTGLSVFNNYDMLAGNFRWIQQESVFWRRGLWQRAGGRLNDNLMCAADFDLWLRFFRLSPLHHVDTILGGFRIHGNALAKHDDGLYEREVADLFSQFVAEHDRRAMRRARAVRAIGAGQRKIVGQTLHKLGFWPWYTHPRIGFDFAAKKWAQR